MIWIIGGTSEAREIVSRIKDYMDNFIVTVATEDAREFIDTDRVIVGRLDIEDMGRLIEDKGISLIIDLTHPYADIVSENAKKIAKDKRVKYIRYVREKMDNEDDIIYLENYEQTYKYLKNIEGVVFFTTGSKNIKDFEKVRGDNRFIYRILPTIPSIEQANNSNVSMNDIVAMLGPFSKEFNKSIFQNYKVDYCVTKDSGSNGGTRDKINACKELGIKTILIDRDIEDGIRNLEEIEKIIKNYNYK